MTYFLNVLASFKSTDLASSLWLCSSAVGPTIILPLSFVVTITPLPYLVGVIKKIDLASTLFKGERIKYWPLKNLCSNSG